MTRSTTPTYEQREENYTDAPPTEYGVQLKDGTTFTTTNADVAEEFARAGATVGPARTGWE